VGLVSSRKRCPGGMRPQHSAQCSTVRYKSGTLWLRSMVNSARSRRRLASPWVGEEGGGGRALLTGEPDGGAGAGGRRRGVVLGGAGEGAAQLVPAVSPSSRTHTVGNKTASCLFFLKSRIIGNFDSYLAITDQRANRPIAGNILRWGGIGRLGRSLWSPCGLITSPKPANKNHDNPDRCTIHSLCHSLNPRANEFTIQPAGRPSLTGAHKPHEGALVSPLGDVGYHEP